MLLTQNARFFQKVALNSPTTMRREQNVVIYGFSSTFKTVEAGVPQGSVHGPFYFLLYINDIADNLNNDVRLANDTSLFVIVDNGKEDECADALSTFNPLKTKSLTVTSKRNQHSSIYVSDLPIEEVETQTHLGLTFQTRGNWSPYINNIYGKACNRLNLLRMLKHSSMLTRFGTTARPFVS